MRGKRTRTKPSVKGQAKPKPKKPVAKKPVKKPAPAKVNKNAAFPNLPGRTKFEFFTGDIESFPREGLKAGSRLTVAKMPYKVVVPPNYTVPRIKKGNLLFETAKLPNQSAPPHCMLYPLANRCPPKMHHFAMQFDLIGTAAWNQIPQRYALLIQGWEQSKRQPSMAVYAKDGLIHFVVRSKWTPRTTGTGYHYTTHKIGTVPIKEYRDAIIQIAYLPSHSGRGHFSATFNGQTVGEYNGPTAYPTSKKQGPQFSFGMYSSYPKAAMLVRRARLTVK